MEAFVVGATLLLAALLLMVAYSWRRTRQSSQTTWYTLFSRLQTVNRTNIERVALDLENTDEVAFDLAPAEIWDLVGGMKGLEKLDANCDVLIDMAFYVQRLYPEAVVIAEHLRLSAREVKWHVSRLQGAAATGNLDSAYAGYAQRAVATYCRMTQSLLELYENASLPETAALRAAL